MLSKDGAEGAASSGIGRAASGDMLAARSRSWSLLRALPLLVPTMLALAGCSGAGNEDLFDGSGDPSSESNATQPAPSPSASASASASGSSGAALPPPSAPTPPPKNEDDPPQATCTPEAEPNNDLARATAFTTRFCGKIESGGDVDHGRFTVPAGKTTILFKVDDKGGKVTTKFFAGTVAVQPQGDELRVVPGMPYTVQIRLASGEGANRPTYEVDVSFK